MIAKNLRVRVHARGVANNLTSKICSAPDFASPRRMGGAGNGRDWMRSPSGWVGSAVAVTLSLTLALLAGCAGLVAGTSIPPPAGGLQVATPLIAGGYLGASHSPNLRAPRQTSPHTLGTVR